MKNNKIMKNTSMLLILNIAKLVFPFITLPYLTRVLSTDCYGVVAYVKAIMSYMQIIIDFGFGLSATKAVVEILEKKQKIDKLVGVTVFAKMLLAIIAGMLLGILMLVIPILRDNKLFTILSYLVVVLTIFLLDFLFRGIEQMHIITIRFVVMKSISTFLTFVFVKDDTDIMRIPILDLLGSGVAVLWILFELKKLHIVLEIPKLSECLEAIKESAVYFWSNVASTSFNVFNTVVVGIVLTSKEIAYWSVCMQIVNAIQALYTPISDAIYPEMVRNKQIEIVYKVIKIFLPFVSIGCILCYIFGRYGLLIVGGKKYIEAYPVLQGMVPVLFFGFLSIIFGWSSLGVIGRVRETTLSTITASVFQTSAVILLCLTGTISLCMLALIRSITEIIMFSIRFYFFYKYKKEFN